MKSIIFIALAIAATSAFNTNCTNESMIWAEMGAYPNQTNNATTITGMVQMCQDNSSHVYMNMMGVAGFSSVCNCTGATCDAPNCTAGNCCGVHVHVGMTCEDASQVGGHYYGPANATDPWTGANGAYYNNANTSSVLNGLVTLNADVGQNLTSMVGRTFIVHDNMGARVGCGVLQMTQPTGASAFMFSAMMMVMFAVFAFFN